MLNQFICVGRISHTQQDENGNLIVTVIIPRSYKNSEGVYESDIIDITVKSPNMQDNVISYLNKGDLCGFKGAIECKRYEQDGKKMRKTVLSAEKITFLSSKAVSDKDEMEDNENED